MNNVVFTHPGEDTNMGSFRKRAQIPCSQLRRAGIKADINGGNADIVVFGKPGPFHHDSDPELAREYQAAGAKVVVDICDNHFNHSVLGPIYADMLRLADAVTCPSETMRHLIKEEYNREAFVIDDPYEQNELPPHPAGDKLLWFGHSVNLPDIEKWQKHLNGADLTIVAGPESKAGNIPWSSQAQSEALEAANIALFPTSKGKEYKTANRLVDAIRAGCFCVCEPHPAYYEFRRFVWVGNLHTGLKWAEAFQDDLYDLVREAQGYVRKKFCPYTIGEKWEQVLNSI